jgi:hypothetical protein
MPRKKPEPKGLVGIEPSQMTLPAMDRVSVSFALILDNMWIENRDETGDFDPVLACNICGETLCEIDAADTLRVLLNTALAHTC